MNLICILCNLPDSLLLKVDCSKTFLSPDADVTECYIGVVREFKKFPDDILYSRIVGVGVFEDILQFTIDANHGDGYSLHSFTLSDVLRLMPVDFYCSINSGIVCGEADYLLKCLSPDYLGLTVAGMSVDDDCDIEFTLIDK